MSRETEYEAVPFVAIETETEAAWLVNFGEPTGKVWLPKSACEIDHDEEEISVPDWLIVKHGLA